MLSRLLLATLEERFADYHKEILFTCIKTKALEDMLDLLETLPGTKITLTHFEDSRATDEKVLKEMSDSRKSQLPRLARISRPKIIRK